VGLFDSPAPIPKCASPSASTHGHPSPYGNQDSTKSQQDAIPILPFTGERIVPGMGAEALFRQHEVRYLFAGSFVKNNRVLDVASGSGLGTDYLLRSGAQSCVGLDIDQAAIEYARARYPNCEFTQCEATRLCLADDSVDVVVSFETIEHIKDQKAFLSECKRVLKPEGLVICSTPNRTLSRWS
jgi:ubiquinone/menaquinone biosynthesis C-methylase UbiE